MAYGTDLAVYVEDKAGDVGTPASPAPWWISPDVDIPAHTGEAAQGTNQVQIRVHSHEEPIIDEKISTEVYVGDPSFVLSPTTGTKRIDPGNLDFRPPNVPGTEPVANDAGGTASFAWTPSAAPGAVDGPGHRCLIVRAFPKSVTPPTTPFTVPTEPHEAQHNIEVLTTTKKQMDMAHGGAGTPRDPRHPDEDTGLWWERFVTMAGSKPGRHFIFWAFDPSPSEAILHGIRPALRKAGCSEISKRPPGKVQLDPGKTPGEQADPDDLIRDNPQLAEAGGLGKGLFDHRLLVGAAVMELVPDELSTLIMRFDLSDLAEHTAVVLHGAQWNEAGVPEGGMTVVALAPIDP
jgi:hypothetical protein